MPVAKTCGCSSTPSNMTCCKALDGYLLDVQQQMLITNLQALRCVTLLASMLQNMSVSADIYSLCEIDLKDFSLQGRSLLGMLVFIRDCIASRRNNKYRGCPKDM